MLPLGAIVGNAVSNIGCFLSKKLNNIGENKLMKLTDLFVIISSLTLIGSLNIPLLCFRRFVIGLACGISSSIIPPFLISFAPIELTGLFGSFHQMFIALGMAISLFFGERLEGLSVPGLGNEKTYLILPVIYSIIRIPMLLLFEFNNL
jgi:MFS family permease